LIRMVEQLANIFQIEIICFFFSILTFSNTFTYLKIMPLTNKVQPCQQNKRENLHNNIDIFHITI
jgi:hypothetical protein